MNAQPTDPSSLFECLRHYEQLALIPPARDGAFSAGEILRARLRIHSDEYSVPLRSIERVVRHPRIVAVPGTPYWMPGALRVGQRMIAVVSGEWARGGSGPPPPEPGLAVVLAVGELRLALLVDAVTGLQRSTASGAAHDAAQAALPELDLDTMMRRIDAQCRESGRESAPEARCDSGGGHGRAGSEQT